MRSRSKARKKTTQPPYAAILSIMLAVSVFAQYWDYSRLESLTANTDYLLQQPEEGGVPVTGFVVEEGETLYLCGNPDVDPPFSYGLECASPEHVIGECGSEEECQSVVTQLNLVTPTASPCDDNPDEVCVQPVQASIGQRILQRAQAVPFIQRVAQPVVQRYEAADQKILEVMVKASEGLRRVAQRVGGRIGQLIRRSPQPAAEQAAAAREAARAEAAATRAGQSAPATGAAQAVQGAGTKTTHVFDLPGGVKQRWNLDPQTGQWKGVNVMDRINPQTGAYELIETPLRSLPYRPATPLTATSSLPRPVSQATEQAIQQAGAVQAGAAGQAQQAVQGAGVLTPGARKVLIGTGVAAGTLAVGSSAVQQGSQGTTPAAASAAGQPDDTEARQARSDAPASVLCRRKLGIRGGEEREEIFCENEARCKAPLEKYSEKRISEEADCPRTLSTAMEGLQSQMAKEQLYGGRRIKEVKPVDSGKFLIILYAQQSAAAGGRPAASPATSAAQSRAQAAAAAAAARKPAAPPVATEANKFYGCVRTGDETNTDYIYCRSACAQDDFIGEEHFTEGGLGHGSQTLAECQRALSKYKDTLKSGDLITTRTTMPIKSVDSSLKSVTVLFRGQTHYRDAIVIRYGEAEASGAPAAAAPAKRTYCDRQEGVCVTPGSAAYRNCKLSEGWLPSSTDSQASQSCNKAPEDKNVCCLIWGTKGEISGTTREKYLEEKKKTLGDTGIKAATSECKSDGEFVDVQAGEKCCGDSQPNYDNVFYQGYQGYDLPVCRKQTAVAQPAAAGLSITRAQCAGEDEYITNEKPVCCSADLEMQDYFDRIICARKAQPAPARTTPDIRTSYGEGLSAAAGQCVVCRYEGTNFHYDLSDRNTCFSGNDELVTTLSAASDCAAEATALNERGTAPQYTAGAGSERGYLTAGGYGTIPATAAGVGGIEGGDQYSEPVPQESVFAEQPPEQGLCFFGFCV